MRVILRTPDDVVVTRDIVDGRWTVAEGEADTIIGGGSWALPGLVDAHSHIARERLDYLAGDPVGAEQRARDVLRAGVMLLLDKGWMDDTAARVAERVPPEERPDIEAAARLLSVEGGYMPGVALDVDDRTFEEAVKEQARAGKGWVKLVGDWPRKGMGPVANFTEDQLRRAVEIAREHDARVAIHTMARDVPSMAVRAGVHSIEHGLFLTPEDVEALAERDGMWVPTILRVEHTIGQLGAESSGGRLLTEGLENVRRLLDVAAEAGAHVLAGTDLVGTPANVASEAAKLIEYGLPAPAAVDAVSVSGLRATGRPARFEPGTPANAVLFPANPYEEPGVLAHPVAVIRLGRLL
ncbi:MAG TPA: amidohydrolase family protein [Acidimicrobiia bacterium]